MNGPEQVFQTNNPARWKRFKWSGRLLLLLVILLIIAVVLAVSIAASPGLPNIESKNKLYQDAFDPSKSLVLSSALNKKYKGFKDFLDKKEKEEAARKLKWQRLHQQNPFIRAAFYSPSWNYKASYDDLEKNGSKLNTIFPEWFFIDSTNTLRIDSKLDTAGLSLMRKYNLRILPMLTNFKSSKNDFDGALIHDILNNAEKRTLFIQHLVDTLQQYGLQGINIDFEELQEKTNVPLTAFQKELYQTFHAKGLLVTMDVIPDNDDYDFKELMAYNDYIVLMAYDEHNSDSDAGSVSGQKWIEKVLDDAAAKMETNKIILGLAGFGYDWAYGEDGKKDSVIAITYADGINRARVTNAVIDFDNDNFNLHYSYDEETVNDDNGNKEIKKHEVWFTGAATTYNIMRFSDEYGTAGTSLWILGKEDQRTWKFYGRDLSNAALAKDPFDYNSMVNLPFDTHQKPTAIGEPGGELLRIVYTPQDGKVSMEIDSAEQLITEQQYLQLPSGYVYEKFAEDTTPIGPKHKLILTFDDGPSEEYTPKILNILEHEKVPATFFVVGINAENNIPLLQRIYNDGYEIGNHTFTHNNIAKMSPERAELEMKTTRLLIECVTGHSTILFRAPYNADSEPQTYEEIEPIARSKKDNYITVGESIDPQDWEEKNTNADSIFNRVVRLAEAGNSNIILLHDAGGVSRQATVDALPRIIKYFKAKGCEFTTVAALMGKTKEDVMPEIKSDWKMQFNFLFAETVYWTSHILFALFIGGIGLSVGRTLLMAVLASIQVCRQKKNPTPPLASFPAVTIIVPGYNEEVNAVRTISSLLQQDYPNLQVLFIDDGSKDATYKVVSEAFSNTTNVQVHTKINGGKASALNYGIELSTTDYLVCIDADTQLKKDAVTELMKKFDLPTEKYPGGKVGAVAGNVKVGNEVNMITRWQSIEYITSQNFDRRAFDLLNCITVVPGAIGGFKRDAVLQAGAFTTDTLAEDCDLTMRLHLNGYKVVNCPEAISYTEAPETMKQFLKQRFRWSFGVMQSFWKHRKALFNPAFKNFGMIALPNILIFQMVLPLLAPLADLILVLSLVAAGFGIIPASLAHIVLYYVVFILIDMAGAAMAFTFEKEDHKKLIWLIPQRLIYRQLMYYILIRSFNKAIKGELQGWGVLKRTGNVNPTVTV
jgi:cellulose synthase/poly-beta-1,6-N-acetylglucosamine synthase-like glycosyltransferase/spore germination protein YaaH/peptidoglycan/xylan/chitin deacetylase (PgdA/CDA1 family)